MKYEDDPAHRSSEDPSSGKVPEKADELLEAARKRGKGLLQRQKHAAMEELSSVAEVMKWTKDSGLRLYSAYPPVVLPLLADSIHHQPKFDPYSAGNLFAVTEMVWMLHTDPDTTNVEALRKVLDGFSTRFAEITSYMANFNSSSKLDSKRFEGLANELRKSAQALQLLDPLKNKLSAFLDEANEFVALVSKSDLKTLREFIVSAKVLFKGACGVRHVDFIAYKPR